jgi:prolyl-tRNA synthetase
VRMSRMLLATRREAPADATVPSHALLLRAGLLTRVTPGVHTTHPLLLRVLTRVSQIVREELDRIDGQELLLPALHPRALWEESGRWDLYVAERLLFTLRDRGDAELCLGPTHEEAVTAYVRDHVHSHKQLPLLLYQIQTKFRDELRPRGGLMRAREFQMKDAYSFDLDPAGMETSYARVREAYQRIFARCGLDAIPVQADSGAIGGAVSEEFMALSDAGEDTVVVAADGSYAANLETAVSRPPAPAPAGDPQPMRTVETPGVTTIEELTRFLDGWPPTRMVKTLLVVTPDGDVVAAMVRGDRELNALKLARHLGVSEVAMADEATVRRVSGAAPGFAGPIGLPDEVRLVADRAVAEVEGFACGANADDAHLVDVWFDRDLPVPELADIDTVEEGDLMVDRDVELRLARGIELGHVFQLGTKYSEAMDARYLGADGQRHPIWMGCYGIGIGRLAAAIVEILHDEQGLVWPMSVAPVPLHVVQTRPGDDTQEALLERLEGELAEAGLDVLVDDRDERAGVKFADADLLGVPLRVTIGRDAAEGKVELTRRATGERQVVGVDEVVATVAGEVAAGAV